MTNLLTSSNIQKRIAVGVMAIAMFFGVFAFTAPVEAQTMTAERRAELQAQIDQLTAVLNALVAQIAALQGQVSVIDEVPAPVENTLEDVTIRVAAEDSTIEAGRDHESVLGMWLSATERDYDVTKLFLSFENESGDNMTSPFPWETFESVSLWVEGDKIAEFDADAQADWPYYGQEKGDRFVFPIDGLDLILETDNDDLGVLVAVSVKGDAEGQMWKFGVSDVRFEDRASDLVMQFGNQTQLPVRVLSEDFAADLDIATSPNSPDGTMIQVDQDDDSGPFEVFAFTMEETNGVEVEVESMSFELDYSGTDVDVDKVFGNAELYIDGERIGDVDIDDTTIVFEDLGIYLEPDEEQEFRLELSFQPASNYDNGGDYVFFSVAFSDVEEAMDDLGNDETEIGVSGGAESEEFILASDGIGVELEGDSVTKSTSNSGDSAEFELEVAVTAYGSDILIPKDGFSFEVVEGDREADGDVAYMTQSNAEEDGDKYLVERGDTEYITLVVHFTPEESGLYRLVLEKIEYKLQNSGAGYFSVNTRMFRTDDVALEGAGGTVTDPVEEDYAECSDGMDNDNDGLIDMDDAGCDSDNDNDESDEVVEDPADDSEVIDDPSDDPVDEPAEDSTEDPSGDDEEDTTPTGEKVYARIVVEQAAKAKGTYHGKQAKLANGNVKKNGQWFWLTKDGAFIKDSVSAKSVSGAKAFPGVTVSRSGNGEFSIALTGKNKNNTMNEFSEGYIEIKGPAKITQVGKIQTEKHAGLSTKYNSKIMVDYISKVSKTRANFGLGVSTGVDILTIKVTPTGEVLGASTEESLVASLSSLDAALSTLEATVLPGEVLGASTSVDSYSAWSNSIDDLEGALGAYLK